MRCPQCQAPLRVAETRIAGMSIRRKRKCSIVSCSFTCWTVELIVGRTFDFSLKIGPHGPEIARKQDE